MNPIRPSNEIRQEFQQSKRREKEEAARIERAKLDAVMRAANASITGLTGGAGGSDNGVPQMSQASSQLDLTPKESSLFEVLVDLRKVESKIKAIAPYQVFGRYNNQLLYLIHLACKHCHIFSAIVHRLKQWPSIDQRPSNHFDK
jgi:hypothetical protein